MFPNDTDALRWIMHVAEAHSIETPVLTKSVLFSDIVASTYLLDEVSRPSWMQLIERHACLVTAIAARHNGEISNFTGDGFLVFFDSPSEAVNCGLRVQLACCTQALLGVRVGIDLGDIARYRDPVVGRAPAPHRSPADRLVPTG